MPFGRVAGMVVGQLNAVFTANTSGFEKSVDAVEKSLQSVGVAATSIGSRMSVALTAPIIAFQKSSVQAFSEFDKAMTETTAVVGDLSAEMRSELERTAKHLSTRSVFSAQELAQAYVTLARAGNSVQQMHERITVVANFAQAGVVELDKAVELLTTSFSALGSAARETGSEIGDFTKLSDLLVKASLISEAQVTDLALAITRRVGVALQLQSRSMTEGIALIATFAKMGIRGSLAAERISIMLRDLHQAQIRSSAEWERLNLVTEDSVGKVRPLVDILGDLKDVLSSLNPLQRRAALGQLGFQFRSQAATLAAIAMVDVLKEFEQGLKEVGAESERVAEMQLEAFANQMKLVSNQVNLAKISIGESLAPKLEQLAKIIGGITRAFESLNPFLKGVVTTAATIVAALGPMLFMFGQMIFLVRQSVRGVKEFREWRAEMIKQRQEAVALSQANAQHEASVRRVQNAYGQFRAEADNVMVTLSRLNQMTKPIIVSLQTMHVVGRRNLTMMDRMRRLNRFLADSNHRVASSFRTVAASLRSVVVSIRTFFKATVVLVVVSAIFEALWPVLQKVIDTLGGLIVKFMRFLGLEVETETERMNREFKEMENATKQAEKGMSGLNAASGVGVASFVELEKAIADAFKELRIATPIMTDFERKLHRINVEIGDQKAELMGSESAIQANIRALKKESKILEAFVKTGQETRKDFLSGFAPGDRDLAGDLFDAFGGSEGIDDAKKRLLEIEQLLVPLRADLGATGAAMEALNELRFFQIRTEFAKLISSWEDAERSLIGGIQDSRARLDGVSSDLIAIVRKEEQLLKTFGILGERVRQTIRDWAAAARDVLGQKVFKTMQSKILDSVKDVKREMELLKAPDDLSRDLVEINHKIQDMLNSIDENLPADKIKELEESILDLKDSMKGLAAEKAIKQMAKDAESALDSIRTPQQIFEDQIKTFDEWRGTLDDAGNPLITAAEHVKLVANAQKELKDAIDKSTQSMRNQQAVNARSAQGFRDILAFRKGLMGGVEKDPVQKIQKEQKSIQDRLAAKRKADELRIKRRVNKFGVGGFLDMFEDADRKVQEQIGKGRQPDPNRVQDFLDKNRPKVPTADEANKRIQDFIEKNTPLTKAEQQAQEELRQMEFHNQQKLRELRERGPLDLEEENLKIRPDPAVTQNRENDKWRKDVVTLLTRLVDKDPVTLQNSGLS